MIGVGRDGPVGPARAGARATALQTDGVARSVSAAAADRPRTVASKAVRVPATRAEGRRDDERAAWAILASVEGLGPVGLVSLVTRWGDAQSVISGATRPGGERRIAETLGARSGRGVAERVVAAARGRDAILATVDAAGVQVLTLDDPAYPAQLSRIDLPPPVLFVRGSLTAVTERPCVAVVGTRRPTEAGRSVAARIAGGLARAGAIVASGLAVGIDGAAHAATVGVGGLTIAVIGGGHAAGIPRRHARLAEEIVVSGGAIVSEHAPATSPTRGTFPRRNRVISGLASATVVVEAGARSGALITAAWALEQGRECFVVPGPIDAPASAGCLGLLRAYPDQVRVVASVAALLEDLAVSAPAAAGPPAPAERASSLPPPSAEALLAGLPGPVAAVARSLAGGACSVDHVVGVTGLAVPGALAALTMLEDLGLVAGAYGRYRLAGALSDLT